MKKNIWVICIILLFTLLNVSAFVVGLARTPPGMVFTGAVHYPPDYFYYLSFIAQGATRWFSNYLLFNAETTMPQLVGWFYTFSGRLLLPLVHSQIYIFQILTIFGSVFYLITSYLLIQKILPHNRSLQLFVFILFLTSSTMPQISFAGGHWSYSYVFAWYNFGDPFERLTNIPHHLVYEASAMLALILTFDWWRRHARPWLLVAALSVLGFVLASIQPATWLLVTIVLGVGGVTVRKNTLVRSLLPALIMAVSGLPFILYIKFYLNTMPPYNSAFVWESSMRATTTVWNYIRLNGPLVITAIVGLPLWLHAMTREKFALTFITALSLLLFFSPIPDALGVLDIRFLSVLPTLFYAAVTGFAVWRFSVLFPKFRLLFVLCVFILIGLAIPLDMQQLSARTALFTPDNAWMYLSGDVIQTFTAGAKISRPEDIFLVFPPFDAAFPGLTGRRIYLSYSNELSKFNFGKKNAILDQIFSGTTPEEKKSMLLRESRIAYVIMFSWITPPYRGLIPVYRTGVMTIYKVPAN